MTLLLYDFILRATKVLLFIQSFSLLLHSHRSHLYFFWTELNVASFPLKFTLTILFFTIVVLNRYHCRILFINILKVLFETIAYEFYPFWQTAMECQYKQVSLLIEVCQLISMLFVFIFVYLYLYLLWLLPRQVLWVSFWSIKRSLFDRLHLRKDLLSNVLSQN